VAAIEIRMPWWTREFAWRYNDRRMNALSTHSGTAHAADGCREPLRRHLDSRIQTSTLARSIRCASLLLLVGLWGCGGDETSQTKPAEHDSADNGAVSEIPPPTGRWHRWQSGHGDAELSAEKQAEIRKLQTIGYASGTVEATTEEVVTVHDEAQAFAGMNFYTSGHAPEAVLADMDGHERHRWQCSYNDAWPEAQLDFNTVTAMNSWRRAHLFPNGDILAIFEGLGIVKLDKNSQRVWSALNGAHHDLDVAPDGNIFVLTRTAHTVPRIHRSSPILEDFVVVLDSAGRELKRVSILECYENAKIPIENVAEISEHVIDGKRVMLPDLFHTNSLEVLDIRAAESRPEFSEGNVLISLRTLDRLAVVDLEREQIVWSLRGQFKAQHDPQILPSGHLLLFDNLGTAERSAVLELDLASGESRWEYRGSDAKPFYSNTCGTAQRLPNGNTLITESDGGRALEVTPSAETAWEFYNPHRAGENDRYIATLFELVRLPPDFPVEWADKKAK